MKKILLLLLAILVPALAFAQETKIPESVIKELSDDLAALHQEVLEAYRIQLATQRGAIWGGYWPNGFTVTQTSAYILAGADRTTERLTKVHQGESFRIVDKVNDWYAVALGKPVRGFSSGWINAIYGVPVWSDEFVVTGMPGLGIAGPPPTEPLPSESLTDRIYRRLIKSVTDLRDKYKNNRYFFVKGFDINIAVPPSVSVGFEFR